MSDKYDKNDPGLWKLMIGNGYNVLLYLYRTDPDGKTGCAARPIYKKLNIAKQTFYPIKDKLVGYGLIKFGFHDSIAGGRLLYLKPSGKKLVEEYVDGIYVEPESYSISKGKKKTPSSRKIVELNPKIKAKIETHMRRMVTHIEDCLKSENIETPTKYHYSCPLLNKFIEDLVSNSLLRKETLPSPFEINSFRDLLLIIRGDEESLWFFQHLESIPTAMVNTSKLKEKIRELEIKLVELYNLMYSDTEYQTCYNAILSNCPPNSLKLFQHLLFSILLSQDEHFDFNLVLGKKYRTDIEHLRSLTDLSKTPDETWNYITSILLHMELKYSHDFTQYYQEFLHFLSETKNLRNDIDTFLRRVANGEIIGKCDFCSELFHNNTHQ